MFTLWINYICDAYAKNTKPLLKTPHFLIIILFFFSMQLIGQNFVVDGDFEDLEFRNNINKVENGFAQLKLLDNYSWLKYSPADVKIYFEEGKSKFAAIDLDQKEYIQTQLCCFPTKDLFYEVNISTRLNRFSKNGISYIKVYLLSKAYEGEIEGVIKQKLLFIFDPEKDDWQELKASFKSSGDERYILIGVIEDFEGDILTAINAEGYQDEIVIDIQKVALQLSANQQSEQKASEKVEF